ncbi:uncharacterized protein C2845_PM07G30700 [Panicum miliaceum]|uniref:Uncharacterized protein n=1 Tax=Panicum miliaceum TaxID=4540 RepID=A0A3L6SQC7_PANMI|nr:uncharacterized protein C2845_PM07G30700 [Panicum miliaceum]
MAVRSMVVADRRRHLVLVQRLFQIQLSVVYEHSTPCWITEASLPVGRPGRDQGVLQRRAQSMFVQWARWLPDESEMGLASVDRLFGGTFLWSVWDSGPYHTSTPDDEWSNLLLTNPSNAIVSGGGGATHRLSRTCGSIHRSASNPVHGHRSHYRGTAAFCGLEEVLLDGYGYIGNELNHTTAIGFTRNMDTIVASFWSERPPFLSRLYVYYPDLDSGSFSELPRILCVVEGLIG